MCFCTGLLGVGCSLSAFPCTGWLSSTHFPEDCGSGLGRRGGRSQLWTCRLLWYRPYRGLGLLLLVLSWSIGGIPCVMVWIAWGRPSGVVPCAIRGIANLVSTSGAGSLCVSGQGLGGYLSKGFALCCAFCVWPGFLRRCAVAAVAAKSIASLWVTRRQLWLCQSSLQSEDQSSLLRLPVDPQAMFGPGATGMLQQAQEARRCAREVSGAFAERRRWQGSASSPSPSTPAGQTQRWGSGDLRATIEAQRRRRRGKWSKGQKGPS